jgi:hypothetical protein
MSEPIEYWTIEKREQIQVSREQASTEEEAIARAEEMDGWEIVDIEAW